MRRTGKGRGFSKGILVLASLVMAVVLGGMIEGQIRPIARSIAEGKIRQEATRFLDQALSQQAVWEGAQGQLVQIQRDETGRVTDLQTDMALLNRIRAGITQATAKAAEEFSGQQLTIPLGTLTGSQLLTGRGPRIPFVLQQAGDVTTQVYHTFEEAGINQTRYQVMLQVTVQFFVPMAGEPLNVQVSSSVCLAEAVIVGDVPQAFTRVETKDTLPGLVADYGAS